MSVDLQQVQQAANLAHGNFLEAIEIKDNTHHGLLIPYIREFLDLEVKRPEEVKRCAERSRDRILGFDKQFTIIIEKVGFLTIEQYLLVTSATTTTMDLVLRGFSSYLDDIVRSLNHGQKSSEVQKEVGNEALIEQLKADAANLGYALALVKQLGANLVKDRLESLSEFCQKYLQEKTTLQVMKNLNSNDVVKILFEFLTASVEDLALIGPIKKIFEIWDEKRERKAGVQPGDTDIMFELDEILARDATRVEHVLSALTQAKTYAETLRIRDAEAGRS